MPGKQFQTFTVRAKPDKDGTITIQTPPNFNLQALTLSDESGEREPHRPILDGTERGIVVSPDYYELGNQSVHFQLRNPLLYKYLFFWDKIQCVVSTFPKHKGILSSPGLDILEAEGVLKKTFWNSLGSGDPLSQVRHAQQMEFFTQPSQHWALGNCGPVFFSPPGQELVQASDLDLQLVSAIELPSKNVHVERILEFKERRRPELLRLRLELMRIRDQVIMSATPIAARNLAMKRISNALESLNRCSRESFGERIRDSLSVNFNLKSLQDAAVTGGAVFSGTGDLRLAILAGTSSFGSSAFQLTIQSRKKPVLPVECNDYHYAFEVQNFLSGSGLKR